MKVAAVVVTLTVYPSSVTVQPGAAIVRSNGAWPLGAASDTTLASAAAPPPHSTVTFALTAVLADGAST